MDRYAVLALLAFALTVGLLANPLYLHGTGDGRTNVGYRAEPVPSAEDGNETLLEEYGQAISFPMYQLTGSYPPTERTFEAPNQTRAVVERAVEEGTATTSNDAVASDLRRLDSEYGHLSGVEDEGTGYFELTVASSDGETTVRADAMSKAEVAAAIRARYRVSYDDLEPSAREAFDEMVAASEESEYGEYAPKADNPLLDRMPVLVVKDGTEYVVYDYSHSDDFDVGGTLRVALWVLSVPVAIVGLLLFYLSDWRPWRDPNAG